MKSKFEELLSGDVVMLTRHGFIVSTLIISVERVGALVWFKFLEHDRIMNVGYGRSQLLSTYGIKHVA